MERKGALVADVGALVGLALQDHGDAPFYSNSSRPVCLVGANLAIRRDVFATVGTFNAAFGRIGASSSDDHEWELRVWNAGQQGLYVPELIVTADVQVERWTRRITGCGTPGMEYRARCAGPQ